jgi:transposase
MSMPGIGPIISSAVVAAIGTGDAFTKGRDFAAWLGLVPNSLNCAADGHHGCQLEETGNSVRRRFLAALRTSQCSPKYATYAKYWCVGDKEQYESATFCVMGYV